MCRLFDILGKVSRAENSRPTMGSVAAARVCYCNVGSNAIIELTIQAVLSLLHATYMAISGGIQNTSDDSDLNCHGFSRPR